MKCPVCNLDLIPKSYANWKLRERKEVDHYCATHECQKKSIASCVSLVTPDNIITNYIIFFYVNEQCYRLIGEEDVTCLSEVRFTDERMSPRGQNNIIISIPIRFELTTDQDLREQALKIYHRLKPLVIFS